MTQNLKNYIQKLDSQNLMNLKADLNKLKNGLGTIQVPQNSNSLFYNMPFSRTSIDLQIGIANVLETNPEDLSNYLSGLTDENGQNGEKLFHNGKMLGDILLEAGLINTRSSNNNFNAVKNKIDTAITEVLAERTKAAEQKEAVVDNEKQQTNEIKAEDIIKNPIEIPQLKPRFKEAEDRLKTVNLLDPQAQTDVTDNQIQTNVTGVVVNNAEQIQAEAEQKAAIKIQSVVRGNKTRKAVQAAKAAKLQAAKVEAVVENQQKAAELQTNVTGVVVNNAEQIQAEAEQKEVVNNGAEANVTGVVVNNAEQIQAEAEQKEVVVDNTGVQQVAEQAALDRVINIMVNAYNTAINDKDLKISKLLEQAQKEFVQAFKNALTKEAGVDLEGFDEKTAKAAFVDVNRLAKNKGKALEASDLKDQRSWSNAIKDCLIMIAQVIAVPLGIARLAGADCTVSNSSSKQSAHNAAKSFTDLVNEQKQKAEQSQNQVS